MHVGHEEIRWVWITVFGTTHLWFLKKSKIRQTRHEDETTKLHIHY